MFLTRDSSRRKKKHAQAAKESIGTLLGSKRHDASWIFRTIMLNEDEVIVHKKTTKHITVIWYIYIYVYQKIQECRNIY